ncbi:unnamed protein product [Chironomus riparius]|uniref:Uncharacterized protein n=1 Tax=Chironomus riparius TaxID=315576 RepID=A0A9N9RW68_9DIPT|nr:unnamed protein product [Chironomus riparius]
MVFCYENCRLQQRSRAVNASFLKIPRIQSHSNPQFL